MNFARWETIENMKKMVPLLGVNGAQKIKSSGMPMAYDNENLYVDSRDSHSLVIGATGSGKTQAITLPMLKLACMCDESVIINDSNNEVYDITHSMFLKNNYNIIKLNFDDAINTNYWNPFSVAKKLYDDKNYDKACDIVEKIGYYLLNDEYQPNSDPFWINSATSYFTGICLYALEKEKDISLNTIYDVDQHVRDNPDSFIKSLDKHSSVYINLFGILNAPPETRASIFSVFSDRFRRFIVKENLRKLLSKSNFDITKISSEKTIIYVNSGRLSAAKNLLPLFIDQISSVKEDNNKLNIIIDDFFALNPIKEFSKVLNYSRSTGIVFTIMVRGFNDLKKSYGKEETEMIRLGFANIVYLFSQDIETLQEISKLCGEKSQNVPLITVEELKTISRFEAVILTTRMMPFRTKLLPYYEMQK